MPRVPSTRDVLPGARVNIVLKEDQPTGRTVVGVVQDVLTRGNHPRGIKVRLADGRVGRVQTMATGGEKTSFIPTEIDDDGAGPSAQLRELFPRGRSDVPPAPEVGLDAYIKPGRQRKGRRGKAGTGTSTSTEAGSSTVVEAADDVVAGETTTCPVCGEFEGDEAAVAHHVATHFDD
ncbi:hypothetical protein B0T18DRAFT_428286 [Schizothecium vesticola]|uniref:YwbE family protein n=1 Tax=Schizothecium vesticola TaxID=314040 RepID=A0AA40F3C7_9PEZI|nr:hypothetical protein B0T18DRAFT_428286 [Schizothecium vesticola]